MKFASRVQGESAPGEVLVSSTTKDLVAGSGLAFRPLGDRELKGGAGQVESLSGEWLETSNPQGWMNSRPHRNSRMFRSFRRFKKCTFTKYARVQIIEASI
jgi:hypothetical protein